MPVESFHAHLLKASKLSTLDKWKPPASLAEPGGSAPSLVPSPEARHRPWLLKASELSTWDGRSLWLPLPLQVYYIKQAFASGKIDGTAVGIVFGLAYQSGPNRVKVNVFESLKETFLSS